MLSSTLASILFVLAITNDPHLLAELVEMLQEGAPALALAEA